MTVYLPKQRIHVHQVIEIVSDRYGYTPEAFLARDRHCELAFARQIAMFIATRLCSASLIKIGTEFGKRDHGTVIHARNKIKRLIEEPRFEGPNEKKRRLSLIYLIEDMEKEIREKGGVSDNG